MKSLKKICLPAIALFFICAIPGKNAYTLSKDYTVKIHGTSNLHNWDETVGSVSGDGIVYWNSDGSFELNAINIKMEVHSIKSDMGSIMNNNTYKALKADANPQIIVMLASPVKSIQAKSNEKMVALKCMLTIAGVTKPVEMQVKIIMQEHDKLSFEGNQTINMSDYGIKPPTALLGTLKTGDEITISFKTLFTIN